MTTTKKELRKEKKILKKLGFKKKWLDDESGYWFNKKIKLFKGKSIPNKKFYAYVDPATKCNHYRVEYKEYGIMNDFLEFKSLNSLLKFIEKNGKL